MNRMIPTLLLLSALAFASTPVVGQATIDGDELPVDRALSVALERDGVAPVAVTLDLTASPAKDLDHPAAGSDVHPTVFDIAMMAGPGPLELDQAGDFHVMQLTATEAALRRIIDLDEVVAVHLDENPPQPVGLPNAKTSCPSTSTRACVQSNYWSISASYGGTLGKVAATSNESAAFWAFGSNNWEVLAKVLNGCGINGYWWVFAGAAGNLSYSVSTTAWLSGGSLYIGSWSATNAPILNTTMFSCN